jgi:hypothetical protein
VFAQDRPQELDGVDDHAVDVDLARLQRLATCEGQELRRDLGAPRGRIVDELGNRREFRPVRDAFLKDLDRAGDDGEDIVEIMGDAARKLPHRVHLLRLTQPILGFVLLCEVGGRAAIAHEAAVGDKHRPAVDADAPQLTGRVAAAVLEIPERLVPLQRRQMLPPFLRLGLVVDRRIEPPLADHRGPIHAEGAQALRDVGENVVRPGLPEPVGSGLGVIAKSLFALAHALFGLLEHQQVATESGIDLMQVAIGALQTGAHVVEGFDHPVQFIGFARGVAIQFEGRRRPRKIVTPDKACNGDEVPGDQPVKHVDDEE